MIVDELIGDDEWRSEWTECKVTTLGKRARNKSSKQRQPEARRKRARKDRRGATTAAERRKKNKGGSSPCAVHSFLCCTHFFVACPVIGASGYQPVRTLEAGTAKETKEKKQRRTPEQLKQQWERGERDGLHQCPKCKKIMTSRPDDIHFKTKSCQNNIK